MSDFDYQTQGQEVSSGEINTKFAPFSDFQYPIAPGAGTSGSAYMLPTIPGYMVPGTNEPAYTFSQYPNGTWYATPTAANDQWNVQNYRSYNKSSSVGFLSFLAPVLGAIASFAAPYLAPAIFGAETGLLGAAEVGLTGAGLGAAGGAIGGAVSGQGALTGALEGGIGGASGGLAEGIGDITGLGATASGALAGATSGALESVAGGSNPLIGALTGGAGGALAPTLESEAGSLFGLGSSAGTDVSGGLDPNNVSGGATTTTTTTPAAGSVTPSVASSTPAPVPAAPATATAALSAPSGGPGAGAAGIAAPSGITPDPTAAGIFSGVTGSTAVDPSSIAATPAGDLGSNGLPVPPIPPGDPGASATAGAAPSATFAPAPSGQISLSGTPPTATPEFATALETTPANVPSGGVSMGGGGLLSGTGIGSLLSGNTAGLALAGGGLLYDVLKGTSALPGQSQVQQEAAQIAALAPQFTTAANNLTAEGQQITNQAGQLIPVGNNIANQAENLFPIANQVNQQAGEIVGAAAPILSTGQQEVTQGQALAQYLATGTLPAGLQTAVNQAEQGAEAATRSQFASRGMAGSSAEAQDIGSEQQAAAAQSSQLAMQLLTTGINEMSQGTSTESTGANVLSAGTQAENTGANILSSGLAGENTGAGVISAALSGESTGAGVTNLGVGALNAAGNADSLSAQLYTELMQLALQQDQSLGSAVGSFASALGKLA